jgi:hypothetical protein
VIADRARSFGDEAAIPVIGMQWVADLDLPRHFSVLEKTAVTDNRIFARRDHRKLRWNARAIPAHHFLDKLNRLRSFGESA